MSTATAELSQSIYSPLKTSFINRTTTFGNKHFEGPDAERIFLNTETTQDISEFYGVKNEVDFLERFGKDLNTNEQFFYLVENQLKFLGEFVGHLKFSKTKYLLNEKKGFNFAGLNMIKMLRHTTSLAGENSREAHENTGLVNLFGKFEEDLLSGKNKMENGLLLSPPKDWNYGFAFYYQKTYDHNLKGYVVTLYPLRYPEERNQLTQSKKLLESLPADKDQYQSTENFLHNPFTENIPSLDEMLSITNISIADIREYEEFQSLMIKNLDKHISNYAQGIIQLHHDKNYLSKDEVKEKYLLLDTLRRYIFHRSKEIWEEKPQLSEPEKLFPYSSQSIVDRFSLSNPIPPIDMRTVMHYGRQKPATITGGGSCPVAKKSSSNSSLASEVLSGNSIESLTRNNIISESPMSKPGDQNDEGWINVCGHFIPWEDENLDDPSKWQTHCKCGVKLRPCK